MSHWICSVPNPPDPKVLGDVRLFAVIGTWMEEDIIQSTVQNAQTQGCERVFLVDNESTDGTVQAARQAGAILARSFRTERYDETERLRHMNAVVQEVSAAEGDNHLWWLFLDADEFPHGPFGLRLIDYLRTLDERFRVVGSRFFDHYPGSAPAYSLGAHPLDCQPLCEELAFPMCPSLHRKHSLVRYDRNGAPVEMDRGFHLVRCDEPLWEPAQPIFLHHFPYREEARTRARLATLWARPNGHASRALESHDTHMLARYRSLDAVYCQEWNRVVNFVALDPMARTMVPPPRPTGVSLRPWEDSVPAEHQPILRWYSPVGAWKYSQKVRFAYGDDTSYRKGMAFLDGHGTIEDWGCGFGDARSFVRLSSYVGVDGSSPYADRIVDLATYRSGTDCLFMRHVLEHNVEWRTILDNAVASFRKRMALIVFTPFAPATHVIATATHVTSVQIPDISFKKGDLTQGFAHLTFSEETLITNTQYGIEHLFYIER